ncbi:CsbD family protein [Kutzneria kofuensis]|uniref:Uncharacterized protein YjbJ (UPF0337 family) n=1 Tax=Kutzneria kofuensis TaxID=103725 RepID=A0A7W9KHN4_9PSEU|nr:CsbD family protein [Kutzneria kofuensis]MBB5892428.1 uncharacterized protein YjbJ (UPF0337 family) [Kutzneria kofuensis]
MSVFDKVKDRAEQIIGQAKQKVGEQTGNERLQAEGQKEQMVGKAKEVGHDLLDKAGHVVDDLKARLDRK